MAFCLKNYPCIGLFSWILDQENYTGSMVVENHNGSMAEAAIQHYSRNENNKQVLTVKILLLNCLGTCTFRLTCVAASFLLLWR